MRLHRPVRESGGEVLVVENPDLHAEAFALGDDGVHVAPPALAAEVGVGARLHAEGAASRFTDAGDLRGNPVVVVSPLPEEGQKVVALAAMQNVVKPGIGHGKGYGSVECVSLSVDMLAAGKANFPAVGMIAGELRIAKI